MRIILSFFAIVVVGLSSCTKTVGSSSSTSTGTMAATVGGSGFSSSYCYESSTSSAYSITGQSGNVDITIKINGSSLTTGIYTFDSTGLNNAASYFPGTGATKTAKSGSVTITTINVGASIIGTFNFICTDGTVVTGGTFNATI